MNNLEQCVTLNLFDSIITHYFDFGRAEFIYNPFKIEKQTYVSACEVDVLILRYFLINNLYQP